MLTWITQPLSRGQILQVCWLASPIDKMKVCWLESPNHCHIVKFPKYVDLHHHLVKWKYVDLNHSSITLLLNFACIDLNQPLIKWKYVDLNHPAIVLFRNMLTLITHRYHWNAFSMRSCITMCTIYPMKYTRPYKVCWHAIYFLLDI